MSKWEEFAAASAVLGGGIVALIAFLFLLFSWFVQLLWNGVLIDVFPTIPEIGYWEAAGLYLLSSLLFKGINYGSK